MADTQHRAGHVYPLLQLQKEMEKKMKYTLYCVPGRNFRPGAHCLLIGKWLEPKADRIILVHGNLPDRKAAEILRGTMVAVFKDSRYHTLSIEAGYNPDYIRRLESIENSQQFCGYLLRQGWNDRIFVGGVEL